MILLVLLLTGIQFDASNCVGTSDLLDCRAPDGSTYIERRLGSEVIRKGTNPDGSTWTERVVPVFDGTRTEGSDSAGHSWTQQCNPRFGRTGNDRYGNTLFVPPPPRKPPAPGDSVVPRENTGFCG